MDQILRTLELFAITFLVLLLLYNMMPRLIRIPFEPYISKFGFSLYIPLFTSLLISVALSIFLNTLKPV